MTDPAPLIQMLKEFRDRLQDLFEYTSDLIIFTDAQGRIKQMNPAVTQKLGQTITNNLFIQEFIYLTSQAHHEALRQKLLNSETIPNPVHITLVTRQNQLVAVDATITLKIDADTQAQEFHYIMKDVSQQKWEQYQYQQQTLRNRELYHIATADNLSLEGKIHIMLDTCSALLNMSHAYVAELDQQYLRIRYVVSTVPDFYRVNQRFEIRETYDNLTLQHNDLFHIQDVNTTRYVNHRAHKRHGIKSYIGLPLYVDNRIYGVLAFSDELPSNRDFTMYDIDFMRLIGQWISAFLSQKRLRETIHLQAQRIQVLSAIENVGIYEADFAGNLKSFNRRLCEITGKKPRELQDYGHRAYLDESSTTRLYKAFANVNQSGLAIENLTCSFMRDNQAITVSISIHLMTNLEGKGVGFVGSVRLLI